MGTDVQLTPADPNWLMARVASLLLPYYASDVPQGIRMMEAEDWLEALKPYPAEAITAAARWWKSDANPDRRKKPLEGDIVAAVKKHLGIADEIDPDIARYRRIKAEGEAAVAAAKERAAQREGR